MKKYFIEITEKDNSVEYVIQSRLFNNEEQAIEWAKGILYLDNRFSVYLMGGEYDKDDETFIDILSERCLDDELQTIQKDEEQN